MMSNRLSLNGLWELTYAEGTPLVNWQSLIGRKLRGKFAVPARVPAPIHQVLAEAGIIEDPNIGINSLKARWVEEQFWVYRKAFTAPPGAASSPARLVFECIEYDAVFFLNGEEIGRHANAHTPAALDVTGRLVKGENLLVVRVAAGLHAAAHKSCEYDTSDIGRLTRRAWQRRSQCQFGWDWQARLINVGIVGGVYLEWGRGAAVEQVSIVAEPAENLASASVKARIWLNGVERDGCRVVVTARIPDAGASARKVFVVPQGAFAAELSMEFRRPRLWWPAGQGAQNLYALDLEIKAGGRIARLERKFGLRRVEMEQTPHPVEGRYCILKVNGRRVFCKGGNWVPPDMMPAAVEAERIRRLAALAKAANFNMLRVWGGGVFAGHAMLDACDEAGLLVWHDLLFACNKYPADHPDFNDEVRREITWAVREYAAHPSLAVWCGNNEIEWADWFWGYDKSFPAHPHYALFHKDIPKIVRENAPHAVHWISSPWSPDGKPPDDPHSGDQHPWAVSLGQGAADWWKYRERSDRFPNEGGVLGASSAATLRQFLPPGEQKLCSISWDHHDNSFGSRDASADRPGRVYQTVELWTGRDPFRMDMEEYAFVSGLLQAEGLQEYISNYRRRMFDSASAIFWMYNDAWPATHGWTIVDYYLRRKLAYHPVRRAFQPVTVVAAECGPDIGVFGINDTPRKWEGELRFGIFMLRGGYAYDRRKKVALPPGTSALLAAFPASLMRRAKTRDCGAFAVLFNSRGEPLAQHRLFLERFKNLRFAPPEVSMKKMRSAVSLHSDVFVWAVCLDAEGELDLPDNCFDLLPGIARTLPWPEGLPANPRIARTGNGDAVRAGAIGK